MNALLTSPLHVYLSVKCRKGYKVIQRGRRLQCTKPTPGKKTLAFLNKKLTFFRHSKIVSVKHLYLCLQKLMTNDSKVFFSILVHKMCPKHYYMIRVGSKIHCAKTKILCERSFIARREGNKVKCIPSKSMYKENGKTMSSCCL